MAEIRDLDLFPARAAGAGRFVVRHRVARTARRAGGAAGRCPEATRGEESRFAGGRAAIRSGAGAHANGAASGFGRRIRATRSVRAETCAALGHPKRGLTARSPLARSPVARDPLARSPFAEAAAGQWFARLARGAVALILFVR